MTLIEKIQKEIISAMKAKEDLRLNALRMVKNALDKQAKDSRKPLDEQTEQRILNMLGKQRRESAEMFRKGNRLELAEKEEAELKLIESFMPELATKAEIEEAINLAFQDVKGSPTIGTMMPLVKAYLIGKRFDGKIVSDKIKARL